jgi:SAM-dependent methyltransferase
LKAEMNRQLVDTVWTIDGDETSWTSWAENMCQASASPLIQELIANKKVSNQEWALDIGCGTGRAFSPLVEAGYRVVGVDPTAKGLQFSQQRALQTDFSAYPVQASAAQLPLAAASIAFVIGIGTLFHLSLTELANALQEIRRVLRPEGEALLHFLDVEDWRLSLAKQIRPEDAPVPSFRAILTCFCSRQTIQDWIEEAGLNLLSLELRTSESESGKQRNWLAWCDL